ncbi:MAG: winged helix-turn-helix transcriptional regulator [Calditrichaeota bacterium]|nr:winged helix-turn-helix transcriptional regulator [Calditrichota bacterium]MCB9366945.1 winged helix-turn-helix transcriptional regulator [Calditrichota bacterium]
MNYSPDDIFPAWCNRAAHVFRSVFTERASEFGLNWAEAVIVLKLSMGHNTLADLTRHLEHSHPAILRHIDKLEELAYVERTAHPEDRRVKVLVMTHSGQQVATALQNMASHFSQELETQFGAERVQQAMALMKEIIAAYGSYDPIGCPHATEHEPDTKKVKHA